MPATVHMASKLNFQHDHLERPGHDSVTLVRVVSPVAGIAPGTCVLLTKTDGSGYGKLDHGNGGGKPTFSDGAL